ncbi:hypothetical protein JW758_00010 [Candidatus Peregrinibacteria bacterium]|nr:hypothetical protein [Candidatus Peregrinibacteria bacterium]
MKKFKTIFFSILIALGIIVIGAIVWFNTYYYFSPLYKPCIKELYQGMEYEEVKILMSPYLTNNSISHQELKNRLDYYDDNGVFCMIEIKDGNVLNISLGREL